MTPSKLIGWIGWFIYLAVLFIVADAYPLGTWQFWAVLVGMLAVRICDVSEKALE
jgi:hypothetical protein